MPDGAGASDRQLDTLMQALANSEAATAADTPAFLDWLATMLDGEVTTTDTADLQLIADRLRARLQAQVTQHPSP